MRLKRQTRKERFFRVSGLLAGGLLLFLCGNFVNPPKCTYETYADEPVQVGENPVINVTTAGTIALDLAPTSADGNFAASSTGSFSVTTGNNSGYTLKLKSTNNGTDLKNTVNNAYVLESIDEATSAATFSSSSDYNDKWGYLPSYFNSQANNLYQPAPDTTGDTLDVTYVANGSTPNEYTLAIGARADYGTKAGTYNNTFVIEAVANAPLLTINYNGNGRTFGGSATTNVAKYDVATNTFHNTLVFGNYMTPTLNSGEMFYGWSTTADGSVEYTDGNDIAHKFVGQNGDNITLYALYGDCPVNKICYDDNGANSATAMGGPTVDANATEVTLWASNFQRSGYGFLGWSEKANPTIGTDKIYGPMETISWRRGTGLKLYAIWQQAELDGPINNEEIVYMQDWHSCSSLTQATYDSTTGKLNVSSNSIIVLTDKRDNQAYAVARLADGNCWMIENLRLSNYYLDSNGTVQDVSFAASNTQGLGTGANNVFVGLANPEVANFSNNTTANSLYSTNGNNNTHNITYSSNDPGNLGYRMPRYRNDNTNSVASKNNNVTVANMADTDQNVYSYGNYYSWAAAIANTMHYTSYSASDAAGTSICPSGWRLPMGGRKASVNNSDFWKLSRANIGADPANFANNYFYYAGNPEGVDASRALRSFPNNFLYSGGANNSDINNRGSYGYYWSSSAVTANNAYYLYLNSSNLYPGTLNGNKFNGFTVRCVVGS